MKNFLRNCLLLLLTYPIVVSSADAGFAVPSYVYRADQLSSAEAQAAADNKPITILYSDKNTDCGLASAASSDIIRELKNLSIIVYVEHDDWETLPSIVTEAISSDEAGRYIPRTVVFNSDLSEIICFIPYARGNQRTRLIKKAKQTIYYY